MTLREYLFKNRITYTKFAEMIDYSIQSITMTINAHHLAGNKLKRTVYKITNGEVGMDEWPKKLGEKL